MSIAAVLWDFGGVITTSPFDAFSRYEQANGLTEGFIRRLNATNSDTNAWAAFERNELDADAFVLRYEEEARQAGASVDARALIDGLRGEVRPEMAEAVRRCHRVFKTALLTNNFLVDGRRADYGDLFEEFDVVLESSRAGYRKPDPRFYTTACDMLDVHPRQAVFLDDLGINLKPARQLGMTTIKVVDPAEALTELEVVTGLALQN